MSAGTTGSAAVGVGEADEGDTVGLAREVGGKAVLGEDEAGVEGGDERERIAAVVGNRGRKG